MSYCLHFRSLLASLLMSPVLSTPVDSVQDMLMSDSQLIVPSPTMIDTLLKLDPRSSVQRLNENHIKMPIQTVFSQATKDRYNLILKIVMLRFPENSVSVLRKGSIP